MKRLYIYAIAIGIFISNVTMAESIKGLSGVNPQSHFGTPKNGKADGCTMPTASVDLDINNVRAKIMDAGDMWWDRGLGVARYEVPKIDPPGSAPSVSSLFAGAIWVGGLDNSGNLRVAAQTYRQGGNDFFTGPLDSVGSVDATTCSNFDYFWKVNATEIKAFQALTTIDASTLTTFPTFAAWPAKGSTTATGANGNPITIANDLAPFVDADGDGLYSVAAGDYPSFGGTDPKTFPDQMIFWVYNDKGNVHTETSSDPIGLQINAMAFAFKTSDDVNSMTFYRYDLYNKGTNILDSTYIAQWVDPDLGCANDDYIGCSPSLGLGICYNKDANDEPCPNGYGSNIPMVGIDFFEGPKDKQGKQLGMTGFYYYYNTNPTALKDPDNAVQFYGYMTGTWHDGTRFTEGGNGHGGTVTTTYIFPDEPNKAGTNPNTNQPYWSMCNPTPIQAGDVRIVESSGPFQLIPGSRQRVTVGIVWVPSVAYPCPSFQKILTADATAQALFDSGFKILDGPDAPEMAVREYDKELILTLSNNDITSNNYKEGYKEFSSKILPQVIAIPGSPTAKDSSKASYQFEGYQIYQLKDQTLPATEEDYHDASKMRLIYQVDIKNDVKNIINWFRDDANGGVFKPFLEASGTDEGITHTFRILTDKFASDDPYLVNFRTYYYLVVAYGYNNYKTYSDADPSSQATPYIRGRKNVKVYSAIPHHVTPQHNGTILHSKYGDQPFVTRVEGNGNGYNFTGLAETYISDMFDNKASTANLKYDTFGAPINIRVFDPIKVPKANFEVYILDSSKYWVNGKWDTTHPVAPKDSVRKRGYWKIVNTTTGETRYSDKDISTSYDQLFTDWGFSINITQCGYAGTKKNLTVSDGATPPVISLVGITNYSQNNGFLGWNLKLKSAVNFWYGQQAADQDGENGTNWIRSGTTWKRTDASPSGSWKWSDYDYGSGSFIDAYDKDQDFEKIFGGTWAPFMLSAYDIGSIGTDFLTNPIYNYETAIIPGFDNSCMKNHKLSDLFSVDIVFTSDKSKWTKVPVVETNTNPKNVVSPATVVPSDRLRLKTHPSWTDKNNVDATSGAPIYDNGSEGLSWFPGYAVNIETGERLNMIFGEDSKAKNDNGNDLLWNPTSTSIVDGFGRFGGRHYIYILKTKYSEDAAIASASTLGSGDVNSIRSEVYDSAIWTGVPMMLNVGGLYGMKSAKDGIIPADLTLQIRVSKPYSLMGYGNNSEHLGYPKYTFSTSDLAADTGTLYTNLSALDLINVVPNPYYAYSSYETGTLDSKIKITNLPKKCKITIYTVDGTLIRQFNRDTDYPTYQDWDMKNAVGVPVSSGLYLIHIAADGLGPNHDQSVQRVIKWFGVMRQIDLNTF